MTTLPELKEELREMDEVELIDLLHITSPEIIERFDDRVEDYYEEDLDDCELEDDEDE